MADSSFMPGIYDAVNKLRIAENEKVKQQNNQNDKGGPRIVNQTVLQVPSEDIGMQRTLQTRMRKGLNKLHTTLVNDVSRFVNHQVKDIDWIASPVNFDLITSSVFKEFAEKNLPIDGVITAAPLGESTLSFLKLCVYLVSLDEMGEIDKGMYDKAKLWYKDAKPVLDELRLGVRISSGIDPNAYPSTLMNKDREKLEKSLKSVRDLIMKKQNGKNRSGVISSKDGWTSKINSLFTSVMTYFSSGTESSYGAIVKNVSVLGDSQLNVLFHDPDASSGSLEQALEHRKNMLKIVKKHGGSGLALSANHVADLVSRNPEAHKEYTRARTALNNSTKAALKSLVRDSGNALILGDQVRAYLVKHALSTAFIPEGFSGKYFAFDEDMNQYFKGIRLSEPTIGGWIKGNPQFNPQDPEGTWMVRSQGTANQKEKTIRSFAWVNQGRSEKKGAKVEHNTENFEDSLNKWREDMDSPEATISEAAHLVELLYKSSGRIGSEKGMTDGEQTFGISSLQVKHLKLNTDGSIIMKYPGKKGMVQTYTIKPRDTQDKKLISFIKKKLKNKLPTDWVFTIGNSKNRLSDSLIRTYMKDRLPEWKGGPHGLRSLRGNNLFNAYLKKHPVPKNPTQTSLTKYWKEATTAVGKELGHQRTNSKTGKVEDTGSTASQSYIDKELQKGLFKKHKIRLPSTIA